MLPWQESSALSTRSRERRVIDASVPEVCHMQMCMLAFNWITNPTLSEFLKLRDSRRARNDKEMCPLGSVMGGAASETLANGKPV